MKTVKLGLLILATAIGFASCTAANDEDILTIDNLEPELTSKTWTVDYYLNNNIEQTTDFAGYILTFKTAGQFVAKKPFSEITGRWTEDKVTKEIILFVEPNADPFSRVSDIWRIHTKGDKTIQFVNSTDTELFKIGHE